VIRQNDCQELAPSMAAASYISCGIACSPASQITILKPAPFQIVISTRLGIAEAGSPSQLTVGSPSDCRA